MGNELVAGLDGQITEHRLRVLVAAFDQSAHDVLVEYGNVGADFSCIVTENFGGMNAWFALE